MNNDILILVITGSVVSLFILFFIIRSATKAEKIYNGQRAMIILLMKLCEQQGVDKDELQKIKAYFDIK